jgi:hypothetical protein
MNVDTHTQPENTKKLCEVPVQTLRASCPELLYTCCYWASEEVHTGVHTIWEMPLAIQQQRSICWGHLATGYNYHTYISTSHTTRQKCEFALYTLRCLHVNVSLHSTTYSGLYASTTQYVPFRRRIHQRIHGILPKVFPQCICHSKDAFPRGPHGALVTEMGSWVWDDGGAGFRVHSRSVQHHSGIVQEYAKCSRQALKHRSGTSPPDQSVKYIKATACQEKKNDWRVNWTLPIQPAHPVLYQVSSYFTP